MAISFWIAGRPDPGPANHLDASHLTVSGDYFRAMRIPLLAGRVFDERDNKDAVQVVIVNQAFAQKHFPNENPLGQHLLIDSSKPAKSMEIVGVVASSHHDSLAQAPEPEYYIPLAQNPSRASYLVLRTRSERLAGLETALRTAIHEIDSDIWVPPLVPYEKLIGGTLSRPKFNMAIDYVGESDLFENHLAAGLGFTVVTCDTQAIELQR